MASLVGEQQISSNNQEAEPVQKIESREGSVERKVCKDRDEKLKLARERQNEERQRKIEELKAQAEAAQRYREQKEEERRRRIEEIRQRDTEKRQQVEERKRAITEAEKERREYILRKNQERESRLETKKSSRNTVAFAFGSSTPRLLEPDFGLVSPSTYLGHRRSTSITNVTGASLSRRSSERELTDSSAKKRATSAGGTDRHEDHRRKSSSMYEVFNWGYSNDEPPKRFSLSIVGSEINIDDPPTAATLKNTNAGVNARPFYVQQHHEQTQHQHNSNNNTQCNNASLQNENNAIETTRTAATAQSTATATTYYSNDNVDSHATQIVFRSVGRRKTDLMPTIPSPRDGHYGSRSSLSHTPRTPGSRSGNVTPGGNISTSRPGSAMSTSTNLSTSGYVARRSMPLTRKQRPASIAGTGLSLEDLNKHKKDNRPPVKASTPSTATSAQSTPKRTSNIMSTSMIVSSSTRLSSAEKKTPAKRDPVLPKSSTPKSLSKTNSSDRLNRSSNNNIMSKSLISPSPSQTINTNNSKIEKDKVTAYEQNKTETVTPIQSKDEKNSLNIAKSEEVGFTAGTLTSPTSESVDVTPTQGPTSVDSNITESIASTAENLGATGVGVDEAAMPAAATSESKTEPSNVEGDSYEHKHAEQKPTATPPQPQPRAQNGNSKENSEMRELTPPTQNGENNDLMSASMIAKSKITTEEEAKAALAERRRLAREEAERQAELERQRLEAERLAELKRQEEEAERQRAFEEEANRLAQEQRRAEEERLRQAIEEAKQKEEEERRKRQDDEKQRVQREEADRKAKEEAEKQRLEVAERLKREEKEREERRKRVEAIMSRTRKGGAGVGITPNSTPVKENTTPKSSADNLQQPQTPQDQSFTTTTDTILTNAIGNITDSSSSTSGTTTTTNTPNPPIQQQQSTIAAAPPAPSPGKMEPQNTQAMYEQAVIDKETALINSFSNMLIDENVKNLHQLQQQQHFQQPTQILEVSNGKLPLNSDALLQNTTTINTNSVANGNGHHIENFNKNDINNLQGGVTTTPNQLIDFGIESQDINNAVNLNNNNSLLNATTTNPTLVTADSHENKDISLL
ncbi:MAP7 domain-containing protein 1 isoform X6 [Eurosta solidaginis]|uniref:MAP7 domain-containing protein 1 isoform X6 n=1 Tax=Eurosta solidaginis TaxID=178769 RepID=UPI0035309107